MISMRGSGHKWCFDWIVTHVGTRGVVAAPQSSKSTISCSGAGAAKTQQAMASRFAASATTPSTTASTIVVIITRVTSGWNKSWKESTRNANQTKSLDGRRRMPPSNFWPKNRRRNVKGKIIIGVLLTFLSGNATTTMAFDGYGTATAGFIMSKGMKSEPGYSFGAVVPIVTDTSRDFVFAGNTAYVCSAFSENIKAIVNMADAKAILCNKQWRIAVGIGTGTWVFLDDKSEVLGAARVLGEAKYKSVALSVRIEVVTRTGPDLFFPSFALTIMAF